MLRRAFRSHCESFALVDFHEVSAGEERIPVTAMRAATLLGSLFTDPFEAVALRRIATALDPWGRQQDNRTAITRLVAALVDRRLVIVRVEAPPVRIPEGTPRRAEPPAEDHFKRRQPPVDETHWLEIQLFDEDSAGVPGAQYLVTGPNGQRYRGYTNSLGTARISRLPPGTLQVSFPDLDASACDHVASRGGA